MLAFQPLVTLNASVSRISGFTLFNKRHHAIDPTTRIHKFHVIGVAIGKLCCIGCDWTRTTGQARKKLYLFLRGSYRCAHHSRQPRGCEGES